MGMDTVGIYNALLDLPREYDVLSDCTDLAMDTGYHHIDRLSLALQDEISKNVKEKAYDSAEKYKELFFRLMVWDAPVHFLSYLIALEFDRAPDKRFFLPRKRVLQPIAQDLQDLMDGKLDEMFLSMPPRTGKSGLSTLFTSWIVGRAPEESNLYVTYSDPVASAFHTGVLEVINDPMTYNWGKIFEGSSVVFVNAKDGVFDINRKKKYHSLTSASLYAGLNGKADSSGIIILDDLLSGIQEAMSPTSLSRAWNFVDNNALSRQTRSSKLLWIGTRWSINDPIGKRMEILNTSKHFKDHRWKVISIPALDENDESNFVYDYGVGFSTEYYRQRRASFEGNNDSASWFAQYQNTPIEREASIFNIDDFRYFEELPDVEPDRKFIVVDPAFGGGDYVAAPVCFMYGEDLYVVDVVYSDLDKSYTIPMIAQQCFNYDLTCVYIEANKTLRSYVEELEDGIALKGIRVPVHPSPAPNTISKQQRIFDKSSDIRSKFLFVEPNNWNKEYNLFMQNVLSFKVIGKNKHDDAPDSLAQAADVAFQRNYIRTAIIKRPF